MVKALFPSKVVELDEDKIPIENWFYPHFSGRHLVENKSESTYIANLLRKFLPRESLLSEEALSKWATRHVPLVLKETHDPFYFRHTFFFLCFSSLEFKQDEFFLEMLSKHLIPGRELSIDSFRSTRFYLQKPEGQFFFMMEAIVTIEEKKSLELFQRHFASFAQAVSTGSLSAKAAKNSLAMILQTRSLHFNTSFDQKIFAIPQDLHRLQVRFPQYFDADLFAEWGRFLALCTPLFLDLRSSRHLSRLIASQFLMRKAMKRAVVTHPERRHLSLRFLSTNLRTPFGKKPVLGLLITLSLFDKYEHFDEEHVLSAVEKWIPNVSLVQGSKYFYQNHQDKIATLYVELDKKDGAPSSLRGKNQLRKILSRELKERVQKLMPLLFTVRNEEQVMKNIIVLSRELKDPLSLPQMMITFEKQNEHSLTFTCILVYVSDQKPIEERICSTDPLVEVILDRKDIIGYFDEGQLKEAAVFHLQIAKTNEMLRRDFSVNVRLARHKAYMAICQTLGNVRDYDGGLILKQYELFSQLQDKFLNIAKERGELLENFFYSITPIEKQATLSVKALETLFFLVIASLSENLSEKGSLFYKTLEDSFYLYIFIRAESSSLKKHLQKKLSESSFTQKDFISNAFFIEETLCVGYIMRVTDYKKRDSFLELIQSAIDEWQLERKKLQVLRLSFHDPIISLDPRLAGDESSKGILKMLFEGLTRIGPNNELEGAIANSMHISPDFKTYTFHLRDCFWSNGSPILAYDFEYAWKKVLSPYFHSPFAYYFYLIKNAQSAKKGLCSLDDVGIHALDEKTLRVELDHPVSYFLELVGRPLFSPIHAATDRTNPHWFANEGEAFVCNGPFRLKKSHADGSYYLLEKNPNYWDRENVMLHQIVCTKTNAHTALEMFKNDELDWLGRPLRVWEPLFELVQTDKTSQVLMDERICWCNLNVGRFPLNNPKLREALSLAIDRVELVEILRDGIPAYSPLPSKFASPTPSIFQMPNERVEKAKKLFQEVLTELGITKAEFPMLHMLHPGSEKRDKTAKVICAQWKSVLDIDVQLLNYSWPHLFKRMIDGEYEMSLITWSSWVNDPMYTLDVFRSADEYLNFPKWGNEKYRHLLDAAMQKGDFSSLLQVEKILIQESPIISLYYERDKAIKRKSLKISQEQAFQDFRNAFF